jgi:hypothetical protein
MKTLLLTSLLALALAVTVIVTVPALPKQTRRALATVVDPSITQLQHHLEDYQRGFGQKSDQLNQLREECIPLQTEHETLQQPVRLWPGIDGRWNDYTMDWIVINPSNGERYSYQLYLEERGREQERRVSRKPQVVIVNRPVPVPSGPGPLDRELDRQNENRQRELDRQSRERAARDQPGSITNPLNVHVYPY